MKTANQIRFKHLPVVMGPTDYKQLKYFKPSEFNCKCPACKGNSGVGKKRGVKKNDGAHKMAKKLIMELERIRRKLDTPMKVTSGYRCPLHQSERNKRTGPGSHSRGVSVDISCSDEHSFRIIQEAARGCVIERIGVKQKGRRDRRFLHLQMCDVKQPNPTIFSYNA